MTPVEYDGVPVQRFVFRRNAGVGQHHTPSTDLANRCWVGANGDGVTSHSITCGCGALALAPSYSHRSAGSIVEVIMSECKGW